MSYELKVISSFLEKIEDYLENPNNGAIGMDVYATTFCIDGYNYTILSGMLLPTFWLGSNICTMKPTMFNIIDLVKLVRRTNRVIRLAYGRNKLRELERINKIITEGS